MKLVFTSTMAAAMLSLSSAKRLSTQLKAKAASSALLLDKLPDTGEGWMTLGDSADGMQAQPASNMSPLAQEHWRRLTWGSNGQDDAAEFATIFQDGSETYYDEYSQAWRALGFYIDCDADQAQDGRRLDDGGEGHCQRYMLWAAYVDEGYSGHGVGEYEYYDRKSNAWSSYACKQADNKERCIKMDCHLESTHFSLIGFFKEPNYGEWMEQLFKHEGDCVWTDDEFQFMQTARDEWPEDCTATGLTTSYGKALYYDLKPAAYGSYDIGLYTEGSCIKEYAGTEFTATEVIQAMGDEDISSLESTLAEWNSAFDVFKQCQPCKAYNLTDIVAGMGYEANADGTRYGDDDANNGGRRKLEDDDSFRCHDAAGYDSVNQCMKFKTKTKMLTASWQDVMLAGNQGTITKMYIPSKNSTASAVSSQSVGTTASDRRADTTKQNANPIWFFLYLTFSTVFFTASFLRCMVVTNKTRKGHMGEPLVENAEAIVA